MALIDDFKTRFPNIPAASVDTYLPLYTNNNTYRCYYDFDYGVDTCDNEIILTLLAHLLTLDLNDINSSNNGSPTQTVASRAVGNVSESYVDYPIDSTKDEFFMTTRYGRLYLQLIKKNLGGVFV